MPERKTIERIERDKRAYAVRVRAVFFAAANQPAARNRA